MNGPHAGVYSQRDREGTISRDAVSDQHAGLYFQGDPTEGRPGSALCMPPNIIGVEYTFQRSISRINLVSTKAKWLHRVDPILLSEATNCFMRLSWTISWTKSLSGGPSKTLITSTFSSLWLVLIGLNRDSCSEYIGIWHFRLEMLRTKNFIVLSWTRHPSHMRESAWMIFQRESLPRFTLSDTTNLEI